MTPPPEVAWAYAALAAAMFFACMMAQRRPAAAPSSAPAPPVPLAPVEDEEIVVVEDEVMAEKFETQDEAIANKAAVLAEVGESNKQWLKGAIEEVERLRDGTEGSGEEIRRVLLERGIKPPRHNNAWGILIGVCKRRGLLVDTGRRKAMTEKSSNGRSTPVYVKQTPLELPQ